MLSSDIIIFWGRRTLDSLFSSWSEHLILQYQFKGHCCLVIKLKNCRILCPKLYCNWKEETRESRGGQWNLLNPPPALGKLRMDWRALESLLRTGGGVSICKDRLSSPSCGEGVLISTAASCLKLPSSSRGFSMATGRLSSDGKVLRRRLSSRMRTMIKRNKMEREVVRM